MAYYGSTPLKILEYMASGCVVVTAKGAVSSHLIRNGFNGVLTTPGDSDDVASKILSLLSDHQMATRLRENARRTVVTTFSWEVIGAKLERKLQEITEINP